jgi:hypothetical protein
VATVPAILGTARLGNFRLGYQPAALQAIRDTRVRIFLGGVLANGRVRLASLTIHDVANDEPDSCSFTVDTAPWPTVGQEVSVTLNSNTPRHLFNGAIQTAETTFEGDRPKRQVVHVSAADDLAALDRLPYGAWTNVSASTVAAELLAGFAPGFTGTHVAAGLPAVSIVLDGSEGWNGALRQIAGLIGGGFYVEDRDLHLFLEEWTDAPDAITGADPFAHDPAVTQALDDSQLRTRVYGRGHGEPLLSDVLVGETILPVENAAAWFSAIGGRAITEDAQRLTYTGVQAGGLGTVAGVSAAPSAAPSLAVAVGAGLNQGVYQGAYTFVTASGESLPSPLGTVTLGTAAAAPTAAATVNNTPSGNGSFAYAIGDTLNEVYTYSAGVNNGDYSRMTAPSPPTTVVVVNDGFGRAQAPLLSIPLSSDPTITFVILWRQVNGGGYFRIVDTPNTPGGTWTWRDGTFPNGGLLPAAYRQIVPSGIATGPSGTTQRKIYRTIVNGSQLKLQQTIANNTATTGVTDATADGSLGATAPVTDTSGLTTVSGQVNAGSPTLLLSGTGAFSAGGGWTMNGIRYTGISGNTLTGIPATGPGSITTTIPYGTAIVAAPALTGVTGLVRARPRGAAILVWVQRDDVAAQAAAAARETTAVYTSDGIHEYRVSDERRNEASLTALCDAYLVLFANPLVTVGYATRDVKTTSGKELVVTLTVPAISQTLTIQEVTITEIDLVPGTPPKYTVVASSLRYSLEGMLRRLSGLLEA